MPSRKRKVTFKRRNDGANLLEDAAGASILKSMGHDDDLRAARTLSMLSDGRTRIVEDIVLIHTVLIEYLVCHRIMYPHHHIL